MPSNKFLFQGKGYIQQINKELNQGTRHIPKNQFCQLVGWDLTDQATEWNLSLATHRSTTEKSKQALGWCGSLMLHFLCSKEWHMKTNADVSAYGHPSTITSFTSKLIACLNL
ncbi:hypothetical protein GOODEAATRI_000745 [Goodea atripinnis]|uniref:Uncharacterized protein n=1 Tax=Goodea atripinnis TaxID=208336 RepID=A0ABV0PJQ5_9TELE